MATSGDKANMAQDEMQGKPYRDFHEAGIPVFPLNSAKRNKAGDWVCDCGNSSCTAFFKHPRARNWQRTPLWDDEQMDDIEAAGWWASGYGVLCKGIMVVDVDVRNGGEASYAKLIEAIPEIAAAGLIVKSGRGDGGRHLYFRLDNPPAMMSHHEDYPGIDFRSGSSFVVGPGSMHAAGNRYAIVYGSVDDIEPAPAALIEMLRKPDRHRASIEGRSVDVSHADIADMLTHIDSDCPYDTWIRIGMAVHHATGGTGQAVWDAWSAKGSKYDADTMDSHWHSFGRSANPVTLGTLVHHAEQGGWIWPVSMGDDPAPVEDDAPSIAPLPADSGYSPSRPPGYVGTLAAWIEAQNRRPREKASVGAALWVTSCLFAGWTDDIDDVNLNLMAFVIAGSGSGKDSIQNAATRILRVAGLAPAVHGTIKSEREIVENLLRHQVAHYNIDEVGELLLKIQNAKKRGGAAHHEGTIGMLMSAYSKANGYLLIGGDRKEEVKAGLIKEAATLQKRIDENDGKEWAASRLQSVKRMLASIDQGIERPYLTMIGFTVPRTFDALMDYEAATNGFMRRALLIAEQDTAPRTKRGFRPTPMSDDMEALVRMVATGGRYDAMDARIELPTSRKQVATTRAAAALLAQAVEWFDDQAVAHRSKSGMESLYLGAYEQVTRISTLLAAWDGVRDAEHVRWAFETVRRDVMAKALSVTANDMEKTSPKTALRARILSLCGDDGESIGYLVNKCRSNKPDDVKAEVKRMVEDGALRVEGVKIGNGKTVEKYFPA